jgi:actin-related protein 5
MSELLFECYHVPRVAYGVDALFSLYWNTLLPSISSNNLSTVDALVISCGNQAIYVLPVLNGRLQATRCRRINFGGSTIDGFMLKVLQLKYPCHQAALTLSRAEVMLVYCMRN